MEWQPIETAPKDKTPILVTAKNEVPCVVRWSVIYGEWEMVHINGWDPDSRLPLEPTYWMPLPAPPEAT